MLVLSPTKHKLDKEYKMRQIVQAIIKKLSLVGLAAGLLATTTFGVIGHVHSQTVPGYTINHQVRLSGQAATDWKGTQPATAGQKLEWTVDLRNVGTEQLQDVMLADEVAAGLTVVPDSIKLYNTANANGLQIPASAVQDNGRKISANLGNYDVLTEAGQASGNLSAQVIFATTVDALKADACGQINLSSKATLTPKDSFAVTQTAQAVVDTGKACAEQPKPTEPTVPTFDCTDITIKKNSAARSIQVIAPTLPLSAGSKSTYTYNFGDGTTPLVTDKSQVDSYVYQKDGTYTVRIKTEAKDSSGKPVIVDDERCAATVTITTAATPPATPTPPAAVQGDQTTNLPATGSAGLAVVFATTTLTATLGHYLYGLRRRV
jgi:uncharacterized repeat protein (TIGR01451 family)